MDILELAKDFAGHASVASGLLAAGCWLVAAWRTVHHHQSSLQTVSIATPHAQSNAQPRNPPVFLDLTLHDRQARCSAGEPSQISFRLVLSNAVPTRHSASLTTFKVASPKTFLTMRLQAANQAPKSANKVCR